MPTKPIPFDSSGVGVAGLSPSVVYAYRVSDKANVAADVSIDPIGGGEYNVVYNGTAHIVVRVFSGNTEACDQPYVRVVFNDPAVVGTNNDKTGYALVADYDPAKTAASQSSVNTVAGYIDTEIAAILAAVDTEIAAIKAKTDNLPASPASSGDVSAVAGYVDTEIAQILSVIQKLDGMLELSGGLYRYTVAALANAGGGVSEARMKALLFQRSVEESDVNSNGDVEKFTAGGDTIVDIAYNASRVPITQSYT